MPQVKYTRWTQTLFCSLIPLSIEWNWGIPPTLVQKNQILGSICGFSLAPENNPKCVKISQFFYKTAAATVHVVVLLNAVWKCLFISFSSSNRAVRINLFAALLRCFSVFGCETLNIHTEKLRLRSIGKLHVWYELNSSFRHENLFPQLERLRKVKIRDTVSHQRNPKITIKFV